MADQKRADPEQARLEESRTGRADWKQWGPYLSERQWGTVREDYSEDGNAWAYFTHDQARSRAYRWGEDGLAGISDSKQRLCFALALWNGRDPILKERLFGLTNAEGNHGEDVKEYYFYLDSTPTHSYMKYLYKYPQRRVPVRGPGPDQRRARQGRAGVRAAGHRRLRRGPLLRRLRRVRQGGSGGPPGPDRRGEPWPRGGRPPRPPHALVPEHLVLGRRRQAVAGAGGASRGERRRHPPHRVPRRGRAARLPPLLRGQAGAALHRERDQRSAPLGTAQPLALREGRDPRGRGARPEAGGEPGRARDQGRGGRPAHRRPGRDPQRPAAPDPRRPRADARTVRGSRPGHRAAPA